MLNFYINGRRVGAFEGDTILQAAWRVGVNIPTLCYHPLLRPYGACKVCVVEVEGKEEGRVVTSCVFRVKEGLTVWTDTKKVREARKEAIEALFRRASRIPILDNLAASLGVKAPKGDVPSNGCVLCGLCVRFCEDVAKAGVYTFAGKGTDRRIMTVQAEEPSVLCIGCGGCAYLCPTGYIRIAGGKILFGDQLIKELPPSDHRRKTCPGRPNGSTT